MSSKKHQPNRGSAGFSILELLVVIAIFLIITGVVLLDIPSFRRKTAIDLAAQEIATCIRGAQVYGTAKKVLMEVDESYPYGAKIEANTVTIFADKTIPINGYSSGDDKATETCSVNGFTLATTNVDTLVFSGTDYERMVETQLEPKFFLDNTLVEYTDLTENRVVFTVTANNNPTETRCIFAYTSGQIVTGTCPTP